MTETEVYYNEVLQSICKSSYELIASPLQFREYVISQRILRWKVKSLLKSDEQNTNRLIVDGKSGQSQNIKKYSGEDTSHFTAKDVKRAENSEILLTQLLKKLSGNKDKVTGYRYDLLDKELNVRPWKANELDFYDSIIEEYVKLENIVSVTSSKIRNNHKNLKRRFFNVDIEVQEEKRKRKRKLENSLKSEVCKKKRLIHSSFVLLQEITGAKLDQDNMDSGEKITLDKMNQFIDRVQLKPRFQLKPLETLLKEGFFEEESIEKANEFIALLKSKAEETSEKTSARKEKLVQKEQLAKSQLTLHQLFKK